MKQSILDKTGKEFNYWVKLLQAQSLEKHGEMIKYLKTEHGFTHGFANLVAHESRASKQEPLSQEAIINLQYKGKEHFKSMYDLLCEKALDFGKDVEIAPKKSYVSLRRKKQFACLKPASKTRFEIGINLKGQKASGCLQEINKTNSMFSHKIDLKSIEEINQEVIEWLEKAYQAAI